MIKSLIIIALSLLLFSGCGADEKADYKDNGIKVIMPSDNTVNGYRTEQSQNDFNNLLTDVPDYETDGYENRAESVYYANKNSKKFHRPSCTLSQKINDENLYICDSLEELIEGGYEPCKRCNP